LTIAESLQRVRNDIATACAACGREPDEIVLVAASKAHPDALIAQAMAAEQLHFGESYAQDLTQKVGVLGARSAADGGPVWHFIGRLQRNKAKRVVGIASLIHAVDSERLAIEIHKRAGARPQPILLAVNLAAEQSKGGVAPEAVLALARTVDALEGVSLRGLMAIPPWSPDPEASVPHFRRLRALAEKGRAQGLALDHLSMGMSHDFQVAIREGATHIRVGTAIFGARPKA
jgi:pyridoxal phosphate enzyme (YggS family)